MKASFLYIHEGFADWEAAFILPELAKSPYKVKTVGASAAPVTSMGALRVSPDCTLADVDPASAAIFILPGGESWLDATAHAGVMALLPRLRAQGVPLAAICGATLALARLGLLEAAAHTSNSADFLKTFVPDYRGAGRYSPALAVADDGIITASGIGAVEFAYEILQTLKIYDDQIARQWFDLFKHGVMPPPDFWTNH
jgi:putative intracellular protease/amidase